LRTGSRPIPAELVQQLRQAKAEVVDALAASEPEALPPRMSHMQSLDALAGVNAELTGALALLDPPTEAQKAEWVSQAEQIFAESSLNRTDYALGSLAFG
jgi:hypothetical protein